MAVPLLSFDLSVAARLLLTDTCARVGDRYSKQAEAEAVSRDGIKKS